MKMVEIKLRARTTELEKLTARKARCEKALEKARAKAVKLDAVMTRDEHMAWLKTVATTEDGWIINKADIKRNGAWYDLHRAESDLEDVEREIRNANTRFEKALDEAEKHRAELKAEQELKNIEELMRKEFEREQKEWAKDGITLTARYMGITPNGRKFWIERNHGWTERSLHCFTLSIDGDTVFTSGEFWRAYSVVKNS